MASCSRKVLIADYTSANSVSAKIGIEIDEMISGHYGNYREYKKRGEIPYCVEQVGASIKKTIRSSVDGISIWVIDGVDAG